MHDFSACDDGYRIENFTKDDDTHITKDGFDRGSVQPFSSAPNWRSRPFTVYYNIRKLYHCILTQNQVVFSGTKLVANRLFSVMHVIGTLALCDGR